LKTLLLFVLLFGCVTKPVVVPPEPKPVPPVVVVHTPTSPEPLPLPLPDPVVPPPTLPVYAGKVVKMGVDAQTLEQAYNLVKT
jgi:hypothetical protein